VGWRLHGKGAGNIAARRAGLSTATTAQGDNLPRVRLVVLLYSRRC